VYVFSAFSVSVRYTLNKSGSHYTYRRKCNILKFSEDMDVIVIKRSSAQRM